MLVTSEDRQPGARLSTGGCGSDFPPMGMAEKGAAKGAEPQSGTGKEGLWRLGKRPEEKGRGLGEEPERRWLSGEGPEEAGGSKRRVRKRR